MATVIEGDGSIVTDDDNAAASALCDAFFSSKEKDRLEKIQDIRFKLIDKLVTDEDGGLRIPGQTSDKILLADLLNNASKDTKDRAKLRIASKATDVAEIDSRHIGEILRRHRVKTSAPAAPEERQLPSNIKPLNVVPGEMSIGVETVSIHEILR